METYDEVPGGFLSTGTFGHVVKVRRTRDQKILACKTILFNDTETSQVKRECEILQQLKHPHVVRLYEVRWGSNDVRLYMEYCRRGSLQDLIDELKKRDTLLSEKHVWTIAYQLASALLYCHAGRRIDGDGNPSSERKDWKTILHRDIKPANVFMKTHSETALNSIRLGDFGLGYVLRNDDHPGTYVGTRQYLAPEISRAGPITWTPACDVFSFGCTLYALCKLSPPFADHLEAEHESYSPIPDIYTEPLSELIASCLSFSPNTRPRNALDLVQECQRGRLRLRNELKSISFTFSRHPQVYPQVHLEWYSQEGAQDLVPLGSDRNRNTDPSTGVTFANLDDSQAARQREREPAGCQIM